MSRFFFSVHLSVITVYDWELFSVTPPTSTQADYLFRMPLLFATRFYFVFLLLSLLLMRRVLSIIITNCYFHRTCAHAFGDTHIQLFFPNKYNFFVNICTSSNGHLVHIFVCVEIIFHYTKFQCHKISTETQYRQRLIAI